MPSVSRSAKYFQERRGLIPTRRGPAPHYAHSNQDAHRMPVPAPLPLPQLLVRLQGTPCPDTGKAQVWPHGAQGEDPL